MMARVAKAYQGAGLNESTPFKLIITFGLITITALILRFASPFPSNADQGLFQSSMTEHSKKKVLNLSTWNIAAINNNPFEYWITSDDPNYNKIMGKVSKFVQNPEKYDVPVHEVFGEQQFSQLEEYMIKAGWKGRGSEDYIKITRRIWDEDLKNRRIMSGFIQDSVLGKKRLISMPDRVTNTINTVDHGIVYRPTVINCYEQNFGKTWFASWLKFMFEDKITIKHGDADKVTTPSEMLTTIKRSKYPAVTAEEESASIPLQTLCCAIFDAVLIYMMDTVSDGTWEPLRQTMCNNLNRHKLDRTMEILETTYADQDIIFLQEVASSFRVACEGKPISSLFDIYLPDEMDSERDQNSFILLKKGKYREVREVTSEVLKELSNQSSSSKPAPVMKGDLLALAVVDATDLKKYILASFHGDTNGLATIPIVSAVYSYAVNQLPDHKLLFGMDANTYAKPESDQQGVVDFGKFFKSKKLNSCYGHEPNPLNFTTFHARTYLQPQLNKVIIKASCYSR